MVTVDDPTLAATKSVLLFKVQLEAKLTFIEHLG